MKFETGSQEPMIPAGEHVLTLKSVEVKEFPKFDNPNEMVQRACWRFLSNTEDDEGVPYAYRCYTGLKYGDSRAGLTKLVDMLVPGMTEEAFADFDSDQLIGKRFRAQIKIGKNQQGAERPEHVYLTPFKKAAKPAPAVVTPPDEDDDEDPFADE